MTGLRFSLIQRPIAYPTNVFRYTQCFSCQHPCIDYEADEEIFLICYKRGFFIYRLRSPEDPDRIAGNLPRECTQYLPTTEYLTWAAALPAKLADLELAVKNARFHTWSPTDPAIPVPQGDIFL